MEAASERATPERRTGTKRAARERLLDAAERLFSEHGFAATTTRSITELAGTSTGTIFYHFRSKEDLLLALLRERSPHPETEEILARHDDPREGLRELAAYLQRMAHDRSAILRLVVCGGAPVPMDMLQRRLASGMEGVVNYLVARVPGLNRQQATAMVQILATSVLGAALMPFPMAPIDPDDLVTIMLKGFLDPGATVGASDSDMP